MNIQQDREGFIQLEESCRNCIKFPIKTDFRELYRTVDVQLGDTVSFDSYFDKTEYDEYDEWKESKKSKKEHDHISWYREAIDWDHLSTTFSLPDLIGFSTLRDGQTGKRRTFWDGDVLHNTPLRQLIGQHKIVKRPHRRKI